MTFLSAPASDVVGAERAIVTVVPDQVAQAWFGSGLGWLSDPLFRPIPADWCVPGAHAAVVCREEWADLMSVLLRLCGWEIRDTLHWVRADDADEPRRLVLLGRVPLAGTVADTVLAYSAGAINIDATRVKTSDKLGGGAEKATTKDQKTNEGWTRPWMEDEQARERHAATVRGNVAKAETLGRWPTNLILTHADGCVDEAGRWRCVASCRVGALAAKHGERVDGVAGPRSGGIDRFLRDAPNGAGTGKAVGHGGGGPVTRYFPQFPAGDAPVLDWLTRLVTPEGYVPFDPFAGEAAS